MSIAEMIAVNMSKECKECGEHVVTHVAVQIDLRVVFLYPAIPDKFLCNRNLVFYSLSNYQMLPTLFTYSLVLILLTRDLERI